MSAGLDGAAELFGILGGLATAVGTGYLIAGSIRKRRLERDRTKTDGAEALEEDKRWKQRVTWAIWGQKPGPYSVGYRGLIDRANRTEDRVFGNHENAIEPTGRVEP